MVVLAVVASSPLTVGFSSTQHHPMSSMSEDSVSVSWLHKAIRDHQWDEIPEVLARQPYLLFQANARGWNALHVAASSRPYGFWWKWILQQSRAAAAASAVQRQTQAQSSSNSPSVTEATNDMGQTVLDLYFRYSLCPLPWQRLSLQEKANDLRLAMESMLLVGNDDAAADDEDDNDNDNAGDGDGACLDSSSSSSLLDHVRLQLQVGQHNKEESAPPASMANIEDVDDDDDTVAVVVTFWRNLLLLLETSHFEMRRRAHHNKGYDDDHDTDHHRHHPLPVLQILAAAHWCPPLVAKFAARLFPEQIRTEPLPLHIWCQTPKIFCHYDYCSHDQHHHHHHHHHHHRRHGNITLTEEDIILSGTTGSSSNNISTTTTTSMLQVLCQEYPQAAATAVSRLADEVTTVCSSQWNNDELPLSVALRQGKSWKSVKCLFDAYPSALLVDFDILIHHGDHQHHQHHQHCHCHRHHHKLPMFCLPAAAGCCRPISTSDAEWAAKRHDPHQRLLSIWCYLSKSDKETAIDQARQRLDLERLDTIYELLRRNPAAIR